MDNLVHIGNADISIKEYKGKRVVTFKDIDMVHERPDGTARKRFSDNRKHFVEGEDYFVLKPSDLENAFALCYNVSAPVYTRKENMILSGRGKNDRRN